MKKTDLRNMFANLVNSDIVNINIVRNAYASLAKFGTNPRAKNSSVADRGRTVADTVLSMCPANADRDMALDWLDTYILQRRPRYVDDVDALRTSMVWACESFNRLEDGSAKLTSDEIENDDDGNEDDADDAAE